MKNDLQSYRSAVSASIRGLVLQAVLASVVLIYSVRAQDSAGWTAAAFMWTGVLVWLALTIVYDQHRRERIEALESEALAAGGAPSVFEGQDQDFRPAAKRLAGLYKFFFPIMSLLIGGLLLGLGLWRFFAAREAMLDAEVIAVSATPAEPTAQGLWALGIGLTVAVVGFIYARYTAGMAKQEVWANLRAGAAVAVGSALLGFLLALAHFIDRTLGPDWLVRVLPIVFASILAVIGVEIFINFLMGIYRPRRPGEIPHPAFESRLLGFAAAPDRIAQSVSDAINYQLGFDVTSGWFYQLLSRWIGGLLLIGVLVVWLLSSIAVVQPHQRGMILQFGKIVREDVPPGAHFKLPWPFQTLQIPEYMTRDKQGRYQITDLTATGVRTLQLGSAPPATTEILWTNEHVGEEVFQYVRLGEQGGGDTALDIAMVSVEIPLQYSVKDVEDFDSLAPPRERDELLKRVAQRELLHFFRTQQLSEVLGGERRAISEDLRERIQNAFDNLPAGEGETRSAGVEVLFVGIAGVHPPRETAKSFEQVVQADQRREAKLSAANAEAIKTLTTAVGDISLARQIVSELDRLEEMQNNAAPAEDIAEQEFNIQKLLEQAGGSAASLLAQASAERWERHMGLRGRAARYEGQLALFNAAPNLYRANLYFDAMKFAMKDARVYITSDDIPNLRIDTDLQDKDIGVDLFRKDQN